MTWEYAIHDTETGNHLFDATPLIRDCSWTTRIAGEGDGSFAFDLNGGQVARDTIRDMLRPSDRMIVVKGGGGVTYAGMPQPDTYTMSNGVVTVGTVELRRIFRWRFTRPVSFVVSDGNLGVTSKTYPGAVRVILTRGMMNGDWPLPLDLPADGSGSYTVTWDGSDLFTINDILSQVERAGNEIFLRPYLSGSQLRFEVLVGTPSIELAATDIPVTASGSPVKDLTVTEDGSEQVTGVWVAGNGYGADMIGAYHDLNMDLGAVRNIPIRDAYWQSKDVKDQTQLQGITDAHFAEYNKLIEQWSFSLDCSGLSPMVATPGRVLNLDVRGDPWIPDGVKQTHVVALSGDMSSTVKVETR